jgi:hypothetical protein
MKFNLIILIIYISLSSCRHEESNDTVTFIDNKTLHTIKVLEYSNGLLLKEIFNNRMDKKIVLNSNTRGKGGGYSYASYLSFNDSTLVVYDDSIQIVHYSYKESKNQLSGIFYDSSRSLYNRNNYIRKINQEEKHYISNEYTFNFTEQDYLDAKK